MSTYLEWPSVKNRLDELGSALHQVVVPLVEWNEGDDPRILELHKKTLDIHNDLLKLKDKVSDTRDEFFGMFT